MSIETFRLSKKTITRLFVAATVAVVAGVILAIAALWAALASDAIDLGGGDYIDVNGGSGAWIALALVTVGSLAALGGTVAAVVAGSPHYSTHGSSKTSCGSVRYLPPGCSARAWSR